jgi:hypothetical protein
MMPRVQLSNEIELSIKETEFLPNRSREQFVINLVLKILLCGI